MSSTHVDRKSTAEARAARKPKTLAVQQKSAPGPAWWRAGSPWASLAARVIGAVVFAIASFSKIGDPQGTVRAVRAYRILPESLVHPFAYALPSFELALAILLLAGVAARFVGGVAVATMAVFTAGIVSAAARGLRIDCGCFGGGGPVTGGANPQYTLDIVRDCLLLLVLLVIPLAARSRWRIGASLSRAVSVALAVVVLAAASGAGIVANAAPASSSASIVAPPGVTADGGILVGDPSAPVHLIAYEDPQCPICGEFEKINGATLERAMRQGKVAVEFRMRSFLGPESVRADNALAAAQAEDKFEALREALFAHQPQEHTGGFSTDELLALGASVGLRDAAFTNAVRSMTYADWVAHVDDRASKAGNVGTPQIIKVGSGPLTQRQTFDPVAFKAAIGLGG